MPGFPYVDRQCFGAAVGLFLSLVLLGWQHFRSVVHQVLVQNLSDESTLYRTAILGLIIGFALLSLFSIRIGMSMWLVPIFFGIYFIVVIVLTRMRAELGFPAHAMEHIQIDQLLIEFLVAGDWANPTWWP